MSIKVLFIRLGVLLPLAYVAATYSILVLLPAFGLGITTLVCFFIGVGIGWGGPFILDKLTSRWRW